MKKIVALILLSIMALTGFTACKGDKNTEDEPGSLIDEETRKLYDTVVMTVNGENVTYEKYRYYFFLQKEMMQGNNKEDFWTEEKIKELKEKTIEQIETELAVRHFAKKYGITVSKKDYESVDELLAKADYVLQSTQGISLEVKLARDHITLELFRELCAYDQFIAGAVFDYIGKKENNVLPFDKESITKYMENYNRAIYILLTEKTYKNKEILDQMAQAVHDFVTFTYDKSKVVTPEMSREEASKIIDEVAALYEKKAEANSYFKGMEAYVNYLKAFKSEWEGGKEHAAFQFFKEAAFALKGDETAITAMKSLGELLVTDGLNEKARKDYRQTCNLYFERMENMKKASYETQASYPSAEEQKAEFALRLVGAVIADIDGKKEEGTMSFFKETLERVFTEATIVFNEDRGENAEDGVYFTKEDADPEFYEAYVKLEKNEISSPVVNKQGTNIIIRLENDYEYFSKNLYGVWATMDYIDDFAGKSKVEFTDFYHTLEMSTMK